MAKSTTIEYKKVSELEFDPENPRLPRSTVNSGDETKVINWMLTDASIIELMGSIGEKGFSEAEPLLVVPNPRNPKKFIVVEGNRRLTAVKLLLNPRQAEKRTVAIKQIVAEAKIKPEELPVIVYKKRSEILDYLGFKHITGVKPWSSLAKAKYLHELQEEYNTLPISEQYKRLAKAIGSRADYVRELLIGLELYDAISDHDFFNIEGLNEETLNFGVFYNALKYSNIPEFIGIDKSSDKPNKKINAKHLEELTRWLSEKDDQNKTKLGESRNLSKLNAVVHSPKALQLFRSGRSLDDAAMQTDEPAEFFRRALIEGLEALKTVQNSLPLLKKVELTDLQTMDEIHSLAGDLKILIEKRANGTKK